MKIFKIKLYFLSALAILATSILFTSCEQNVLELPETPEVDVEELSQPKHSRNIQILSENRLNKVSISITGNDESLLREINSTDFKVVPIFEKPEGSIDKSLVEESINNVEDTDLFSGQIPLAFSVEDAELEEGAIGYEIEVKRTNNNRAIKHDYWYSTKNKVKVTPSTSCITISFHKRLNNCQWNSFKWTQLYKGYRCPGHPVSHNTGNTCQIAARIDWNNSNYTWYYIKFWN